MLGSLSKILPGVDALIEFKEVIESYLGIADFNKLVRRMIKQK